MNARDKFFLEADLVIAFSKDGNGSVKTTILKNRYPIYSTDKYDYSCTSRCTCVSCTSKYYE